MGSRYGHAWASQYGTEPSGIAAAEWRSTLAGITTEQMRMGFEADAVRGDKWPPSSPSFKAMCLGIPSMASVRAEVRDYLTYRHPFGEAPVHPIICRFARGLIARLDTYAYRNATGKTADRIFEEAYQRTREFVMEGGTLPVEPSGYIERKKPDTKPASPEEVARNLSAIAEMLGVNESEGE